jgi:leader peptidase (prepilin peptidase)/N-methyltransferase
MWLAPGAIGAVSALLGWQLVLLAMLDAEHFWLPHRLTAPLGLMGLAEAALFTPDEVISRLAGAVAGFAILAVTAWAYRRFRGREGLGGGDSRLLAAAGAWVGIVDLPSVILLAAASGLVAALGATLFGRRTGWTTQVPFGVFIAVGLWVTWHYGGIGR